MVAAVPIPMQNAGIRPKKDWSPLLWLGCDTITWIKLLANGHFAIHWSRWHVVAIVSVVSLFHSVLGLMQRVIYGRRIARTTIHHAPVFILGHWRTGTTLLHELLSLDPCHAFPTTYDCLAPHHFLLSRSWMPGLFRWLLPKRRPMDNMAAGWDRPQEDEFALCLLGEPSPYTRIAFPNQPVRDDALDLASLPSRSRRRWKDTLYRLVQTWTFVNRGRRLILKSPPHTCRIPALLEMFPDARFIHIVRDPYVVYPSTLNLWRFLYGTHSLQRPAWELLPPYIISTFSRLNDCFQKDKEMIPSGRLHEVRYENLIHDPIGQLELLYRKLDLGDFEVARPRVEAYRATMKEHETNKYFLTPSEFREIGARWSTAFDNYGYAKRSE